MHKPEIMQNRRCYAMKKPSLILNFATHPCNTLSPACKQPFMAMLICYHGLGVTGATRLPFGNAVIEWLQLACPNTWKWVWWVEIPKIFE